MLAFLAVAGGAQANALTVQDGNDVAGPLDIRSVSHSHAGTKLVHTIRTFSGWGVGLLGPRTPNYFLLELNTDSDRPPERSILVFSSNGRLVASVFGPGPRHRYLGTVAARHPNRKMLRLVIPRQRIGNPAGYKWQAFAYFKSKNACKSGCFDRAPNGSHPPNRVLHDIRAPKIVFSQPAPTSTPYNLDFTVTDPGGAGLASWRLEHRDTGTAPWDPAPVGEDTLPGPQSVLFPGAAPGDSDQFRVVATDAQGNRRISPVRTVTAP